VPSTTATVIYTSSNVIASPVEGCLDIAKLAAERELHALSFKAIRQALAFSPVNQSQRNATTPGDAAGFNAVPAGNARMAPLPGSRAGQINGLILIGS